MPRVLPGAGLIALTWVLATTACAPETVPDLQIELPEFSADAWPLDVVLPGSRISLTGTGFLDASLGEHVLVFSPTADGAGALRVPLERIDAETLRFVVDDAWQTAFPTGSTFDGVARLERTLLETGQVDSVDIAARFEVAENLTPQLISIQVAEDAFYPGDIVELLGNGFLLAGEGHTVVLIEGSIETLVPPETRPIQVVLPLTGSDRGRIALELTPDIFGIRPGVFRGEFAVTNETPISQAAGTGLDGLEYPLQPPRIEVVSPSSARRGQRIVASGRGFLATDPPFEATTLFRLEGEFEAAASSGVQVFDGPTALALFPDAFTDNTTMEYILRVTQTPAGDLEGLGLLAGQFRGVVRPLLISGPESILGTGPTIELNVLPQRQIVFIDYLPGFSTTVAEMGLAALEAEVRARILEVCTRDYTGVNIEFRDERPTDFAEYSIVEVGGQDPNQAGLFGLDNTSGKDVGNIRFNDIIGGTNAETREQGYFAFGGVFVRSFFQLSPSLPDVQSLPIASPRFDDVFGPFMPALGGSPVDTDDASSVAAQRAVRVLGNLVGNTVVHEIGHSLGLSNIDGEFHNIGDNEGWIMDSGSFRPFIERAELDGAGPARFSPNNQTYLERILPLEAE